MNKIPRDAHGHPTNGPHGNSPDLRPVTQDGRLGCCIHNLWDKTVHDFWLDGKDLGQITLAEALAQHNPASPEAKTRIQAN